MAPSISSNSSRPGCGPSYDEPANVLARARRNAEHARQIWSGLQLSQETGPALLLSYLKAVNHAANAVALLTGSPAGRTALPAPVPFAGNRNGPPAGVPDLAADFWDLLGGDQVDAATPGWISDEWEKSSFEAANRDQSMRALLPPVWRTTNWLSRPCWPASLPTASPLAAGAHLDAGCRSPSANAPIEMAGCL